MYGSSYTSAINFDSRVLIYNNKFFNNEELGITGLDLPTGSGISIGKGINWDKLDIRNNIFDMAVNGEVITATGYDLIKQRKVCVDNNSFKNCYIYLEKLDSEISFNTIDSCNNFLMKVDSSHTNVFTSNILNNCTGITDMSCVYKSVLRLSNNTFINCNDLVKSKTYAYGFMWVNNTFEKCTNIFNISLATGKDSISGDFVFFNNTLQESTIADIVNQSLVDRVNIMQNIEYDGTSWRTLQLTTTV